LDSFVNIHANTANTRQVKNADKRLRSVADNFTNAIFKAKSGKHKGKS
jgi:hypothetical protein